VDNSSSFTAPLTLSSPVSGTQSATSTLPKGSLSWRVRALDAAGNPRAWSAVRALTIR
jgi:hypothetical protein